MQIRQLVHCIFPQVIRALILVMCTLAGPPAMLAAVPEAQVYEIQTDRGRLHYTTAADPILLHDSDGELAARIVGLAYTATGRDTGADRPVTFIFNGGPGSASVWLHVGFCAPRRVPDELAIPGARKTVDELVDNPYTLLTVSDLVFVDPVGTGFSKAAGDYSERDFWGVTPDAMSIAAYVGHYLKHINRPDAPVFILGESYGGIRAAAMLSYLHEAGINTAGAILISPALDAASIVGGKGPLPKAFRLPSYAATAWYHNLLPARSDDLFDFLRDVQRFAFTDYLDALNAHSELSDAERGVLVQGLHACTGVDRSLIDAHDLRIRMRDIRRLALRGKKGIMGSFDARYVSFDRRNDEVPRNSFHSALKLQLQEQFDINTGGRYTTFSGTANSKWRSANGKTNLFNSHIPTIESLESAMDDDPNLRVFLATGIYDLVTPFAAAHYLVEHSALDPARTIIHDYESGHMIYLNNPSFRALSRDVRRFITDRTHQAMVDQDDVDPGVQRSDRDLLDATAR